MKSTMKIFFTAWCFYVVVIFQTGFGRVRLPRLISDGMVLQRDANVNIWGWANEGEEVTIKFINKLYHTTADHNGKWVIILSGLKAGGPYNMEVTASNQIILKNILIGDVWICSGQSNMVLPMNRVRDLYEDDIAESENPHIRHFWVPMKYNFITPQEDIHSGTWGSANPKNVLYFSATAYFFAKSLYEKYHVPIGLINAGIGGTPITAWLSENALEAFPSYLNTAEKFKDKTYVKKVIEEDKAIRDAWYRNIRQRDKGFTDRDRPWFDPTLDASTWSTIYIPSYWQDEGTGIVNGVVWFRKEIDIPSSMIKKPALLRMGRIVDSDSVYINGIFIGSISYQYPPRKYKLPENVLKAGKNTIVVRVINESGKGGFIKDKPYQLTAGGQTIDLKGEWQYRLGTTMDPLPGQVFIQYKPLGLYNGMIAPLLNYTIKGVIWYQGESDTERTAEYQDLFSALITDWRQRWNRENFPFLYVQLANYMEAKDQPAESHWAALRDSQLKTLSVPNTGMAVAIDIGEWNDVHPLNKEDVGKRLALAAQKVAFGNNVVYSGPIYQSMQTQGNKIVITFTNTGSGLMVKGEGDLKHFAIAGMDRKFVWAKAHIEGDHVVVWNDKVKNPVAVRYAWADNPEGANLYNKEGLPASPFRTDNF